MVTFIITEYSDGTCRVETKHMHYHFRDELFYDGVNKEDIVDVMGRITSEMNNTYGVGVVFELA